MTSPPAVVRAAGAVVWRDGDGGREVLLIHRPRYDDWTFPKGKRDPGESDEECALREIREETGLLCTLGDELPATEYVDGRGRPKVVRYWKATVSGDDGFQPGDEVDELAWVPPDEAARRLTYGRDRPVLDAFLR